MDEVFVYWDDSNLIHEARRTAEDLPDGPDARCRVRVDYDRLLHLAQADRPLVRVAAAGPPGPEWRRLGNRLENAGVEVTRPDRTEPVRPGGEQPTLFLALRMLEDALDRGTDPGVAVVLTGDGAGYGEGLALHRTLDRMRRRGWRFEVLAWARACNRRLRRWAEENGVFVPLDDFYSSITFTVPSGEGQELARPRHAAPLDLSARPRV